MTQRILVTPGEPAGIGPELLTMLAADNPFADDIELVAVADPELLAARAKLVGCHIDIEVTDATGNPAPTPRGTLKVAPVALREAARPGKLTSANAPYVIDTLTTAADLCLSGQAAALVTGPVQKSVINDAGIPFPGHTEFLRDHCGTDHVVMMLANQVMRVALVTTHIPLRAVPDAITIESLTLTLRIVDRALREQFGLEQPQIAVLGLNPHAGESGHLGSEEIEVITPAMRQMSDAGLRLRGPLPADTAFTAQNLKACAAFVAMYHDQGLTVLKYAGFGDSVNITLGLPFIRCSVDHGTALDLAGTGSASTSSLRAAIATAADMAASRKRG